MNFGDPNDGWTLFHELEHVVQYANRGGVEPFLSEYVLKAAGSILRGGNSIDMHDNIDLENAANAQANQVANAGLGAQANVVAPAILPAAPMGIFVGRL
jgi:predicted NBD/HSP70 family sugar kinase